MSQLRLTSSPQRTPPSAGDDAAWIDIRDAAPVLGVTVNALRVKCQAKFQPMGRARLVEKPRSDGRLADQWQVHATADARLLQFVERGRPAPDDRSAILSRYPESKVRLATDKASAVIAFRKWRTAPGVDVVRDLPEFAATLGLDPTPSKTTLYRWHEACPESSDFEGCVLAMLDTRGGARSSSVSPEAWAFFRGCYLTPQRWSVAKCHRTVRAKAKQEGWTWPGLRTIERLVRERITHDELVLTREGREAWDRKCKAPIEQDPDLYQVGERWEADHSRLDFLARVQRGGRWVAERLWLCAFMDWRSRRLVGWQIDERANSDTIRAALLRALRDDSVSPPEKVWLDNGKDFASAEMVGATKTERRRARGEDNRVGWGGILRLLQIEPHFAIPYNPNGKPRVEKVFDFMHRDFCRGFNSWIGSKPGDVDKHRRAELASAERIMELPTPEQVRDRFAEWVEFYNKRSEHSIEDLADGDRRLSPVEFYEANLPARRVLARPEMLRLLEPRWSRALKVRKVGISLSLSGTTLRFGDTNPALDAYRNTERLVRVTYDPSDLSRVHVYDAESLRLVCIANANERTRSGGPVSAEALKRANKQRREQMRRAKERIDTSSLTLSVTEAAAAEQRKMDIDETNARLAEQGVTQDQPAALRIVRTPLDDAPDLVDRAEQRLRKAAGAEHHHPDDDDADRPTVIERLAAQFADGSAGRQEPVVFDDDEVLDVSDDEPGGVPCDRPSLVAADLEEEEEELLL